MSLTEEELALPTYVQLQLVERRKHNLVVKEKRRAYQQRPEVKEKQRARYEEAQEAKYPSFEEMSPLAQRLYLQALKEMEATAP